MRIRFAEIGLWTRCNRNMYDASLVILGFLRSCSE